MAVVRSRALAFCADYAGFMPSIANPSTRLAALLPSLAVASPSPCPGEDLPRVSGFFPQLVRPSATSDVAQPWTVSSGAAGSAAAMVAPVGHQADIPAALPIWKEDFRASAFVGLGLGASTALVYMTQKTADNTAGEQTNADESDGKLDENGGFDPEEKWSHRFFKYLLGAGKFRLLLRAYEAVSDICEFTVTFGGLGLAAGSVYSLKLWPKDAWDMGKIWVDKTRKENLTSLRVLRDGRAITPKRAQCGSCGLSFKCPECAVESNCSKCGTTDKPIQAQCVCGEPLECHKCAAPIYCECQNHPPPAGDAEAAGGEEAVLPPRGI